MAITLFLFNRPVTVELFLIVGWTVLALSVVNALYGSWIFSRETSVVFAIIIGIAATVSLLCYIFYYRLGSDAGYIAGMVPLLLRGAVSAALSIRMAV